MATGTNENESYVLITGGGGGLGCEVTASFVEAGAKVTVVVAGPTDVAQLRARLGDRLDAVRQVQADLRDEDEVRQLIEQMPGLHALVHLVGGFGMGPLEQTELSEYRRLVDLNLTSTFLMLKHAVARMKRDGYGRIVTVGSKAAVEPAASMGIYGATKAGVLHLTRVVAEETRDLDITANCVLPSIIDTPANRQAMGEAEAEKWVSPRSLAHSIAILASEQARDLRGTALRVFGRV